MAENRYAGTHPAWQDWLGAGLGAAVVASPYYTADETSVPVQLATTFFGLAILLAAFMFGIQPVIAIGPDGMPLYAPYPLSIAIPAMAIEHLFLFSIVEGVMTLVLLKYFLKNESTLVYAMRGDSREEA